MINTELRNEYDRWCALALADGDLKPELEGMDDAAVEDAFYKNLAFGTAGLRGVIGAGTNRMNVYTVAKASLGLAMYVIKNFPEGKRAIAISRDSRIKGELFAKVSAGVFASKGIKVWMYTEIMPTPCLSFAVRELNCSAGIMVTASHNPAKYNGYKVYNDDGCQITSEAADEIAALIDGLDVLEDVKDLADLSSYEAGVKAGLIQPVGADIDTAFIECVKKQTVLGENDEIDRNVSIVYTPLNGTGLVPVTRALKESGFTNITVVKEQELPDGNFPTCPYPNPEIHEAMALGMDYAARYEADLLIATDPDADRMGIAVRNSEGKYQLITGNESGMLMLDYICSRRQANGTMPSEPVMVKSIVTTDMAGQIAEHYGVKTVEVLTGFKYIGETIKSLEAAGKADSYIFGFEESYGYLSGSYVRDKDAVDAAFILCEMFAYYKTRGISILDKLEELYKTYGYRLNTVYSFEFEGSAGFKKMQDIMTSCRAIKGKIAGHAITKFQDFNDGIDGLPAADVLRYYFDGGTVIVRPSGTEPKLKVYISVSADSKEASEALEAQTSQAMKELIASL